MINTRIICTIGPASNDYETLQKMYDAGMTIVRLNMSHGSHKSHSEVIEMINRLNREVPFPVGLLLDTQGPEIRTGSSELDLVEGDQIRIEVPPSPEKADGSLYINYPQLIETVNAGDKVTVDSGLVNLKVMEKGAGHLNCLIMDGGHIKGRRHVNLPGIHVDIPAITEKDKSDILYGMEKDIDYIALSFVRDKNAAFELKKLLGENGNKIKIIAKIENYEGVNNLDEIIREVDGIMVARGDLGIEIDMEDLPAIQRGIAHLCAVHGKGLIIATHLLESMIENPIPTRAEVTDIANAVFEEADAIMLSGETAGGKYPVRAVEHMVRTARKAEQHPGARFVKEMIKESSFQHIAAAAIQLVNDLKLKGIMVFTQSGQSAITVSSFRPTNIKIYAFTDSGKTRKTLMMYRSVFPFLIKFHDDFEETVQSALEVLRETREFDDEDQIVVIHEIMTKGNLVPSIQVRDIKP